MNEVQGFQALVSTGSAHPYNTEAELVGGVCVLNVREPDDKLRREQNRDGGGGGASSTPGLQKKAPPGFKSSTNERVVFQELLSRVAFNLNLVFLARATTRRPRRAHGVLGVLFRGRGRCKLDPSFESTPGFKL